MSQIDVNGSPAQALELGELLGSAMSAVVQAQERLDEHTRSRIGEYEQAVPGELALPPLWYTFTNVAVEIELSATVQRFEAAVAGPATGRPGPDARLLCRTVNPTMVGLYGREASAGMRVRLQVSPRGVPIKPDTEE